MDVFTMVVVIVGLSIGGGVVNNYLKPRRSQLARSVDEDLCAEVARLAERVRVLEAIVTDPARDLKTAFEQLEREG